MRILAFSMMILLASLAGCSAASEDKSEASKESKAVMDTSQEISRDQASLYSSEKVEVDKETDATAQEMTQKMVIYQANLQLRVKKFEQTVVDLEEKAKQYGGYVTQSTVSKDGDEQMNGTLTIRVPQTRFQDFLAVAEGKAAEVLERNITGQDVTEEYVDLEARLRSKKVVEERLIAFMNAAQKTEDLLKISSDLAAVQEEIETITGKMKFLENQTFFSTVTISLYENKVHVPNLDKEKLNTWEKTKEQFIKSINMLLSFFSGVVIFIFGNLPVLLIFGILGLLIFFVYRKKKNRRNTD